MQYGRVVSVGECMVELREETPGLWRQGFSGDTFNTAWAMRALLPPEVTVDYLTCLGTDDLSAQMIRFFSTAGIGTGHIRKDPLHGPGLYAITTDDKGERSFTYWRSTSAARGLADDRGWLDHALSAADLVYVSGITLAILSPDRRATLIAALGKPSQRPFKLAFDPNIRPTLWDDKDAMRATLTNMARISDIVLPTHDDEGMAFGDRDAGETRDRYRALGVAEVVVKDGIRPTLTSIGSDLASHDVTPAVRVVDTTGAGDSFAGAYLSARLSGADPSSAVRQAQAVAATVVQQKGAVCSPALLQAARASVSA